jgi:hypothetical protein
MIHEMNDDAFYHYAERLDDWEDPDFYEPCKHCQGNDDLGHDLDCPNNSHGVNFIYASDEF